MEKERQSGEERKREREKDRARERGWRGQKRGGEIERAL